MNNKLVIVIAGLVMMLCITSFAFMPPAQAQGPDATIMAAEAAKLKRQSELAATAQAEAARQRAIQATAAYWAGVTATARAQATATAQAQATATAQAQATATAIANATATAQAQATATVQAQRTATAVASATNAANATATVESQKATATYDAELFNESMRRQNERVNVGLRAAVVSGVFLMFFLAIAMWRQTNKKPEPVKEEPRKVYVAAPITRDRAEPESHIPKPEEIKVDLGTTEDTEDLWQFIQDEGIKPEGLGKE